jgi:hypothetical protein
MCSDVKLHSMIYMSMIVTSKAYKLVIKTGPLNKRACFTMM